MCCEPREWISVDSCQILKETDACWTMQKHPEADKPYKIIRKKTLKPQIATTETKQQQKDAGSLLKPLLYMWRVLNVCFVVLEVKDKLDIELQKQKTSGTKQDGLQQRKCFSFSFLLCSDICKWFPGYYDFDNKKLTEPHTSRRPQCCSSGPIQGPLEIGSCSPSWLTYWL